MIVLFTDFGLQGPYMGQMKAVLFQMAPGIPVIDLFADAPVANPKASSFYWRPMPNGSWKGRSFSPLSTPVSVERVRPSFWRPTADGTSALATALFELVERRAANARRWDIVWKPERLSASFHGRDLFAPVAAKLARGEPPPGRPRKDIAHRRTDWPDDLSEIVYMDHYGNAMSGLRAVMLPRDARLVAAARVLQRAGTFSDRPPGTAFWYENSNGLAEISVNQGRADRELGLAIGSRVEIVE